MELAGRIILVTGAARGLGRAYAHRLASLGAKVALCDLNLKSYAEFEIEAKAMTGDSTVAEIEAQTGVTFPLPAGADKRAVAKDVWPGDLGDYAAAKKGVCKVR